MNKKKNYDKGPRKQIVELIHLCGVVPDKSLRYIHTWNYNWARRKITDMVNEKTLAYVKRTPKPRVLTYDRLEEGVKKEIEKSMPEELRLLYEKYTSEDRHKYIDQKKDKAKISRIYLNADTNIFIYGIGIEIAPDKKPSITKEDHKENVYYTSREIKQGLKYQAEVININGELHIANSKIRGLLMSNGGDYSIYRTDCRTDYSKAGEYKIKIYIERAIKAKRGINAEINKAVLIVDINKKDILPTLMDPDINDGKYTYTNLENLYTHVYGLPANIEGQKLLSIMTKGNWRENMLASFGMPLKVTDTNITCDDYKDGVYYLLFCIPDIKRLRRFIIRAELEEEKEKFVVVCFDMQIDMVRKATKGKVKIKSIPLATYMSTMGYDL